MVEKAPSTIQTDVGDLLDEGRWSRFAEGSAAAGVGSTLSLSVLDRAGQLIGSINLHASTVGAFTGLHDALAEALGASAAGAIANADMAFTSRDRAIAHQPSSGPVRNRDRRGISVRKVQRADHQVAATALQVRSPRRSERGIGGTRADAPPRSHCAKRTSAA